MKYTVQASDISTGITMEESFNTLYIAMKAVKSAVKSKMIVKITPLTPEIKEKMK